MKVIGYIVIGIICLILFLCVIYFILIGKLKKFNSKFYKYKEEIELKENNVLIIYQPSRHKTTFKIKELVKQEVVNKGYGVKVETLSNKKEAYNNYKYVFFIVPVYFGEIHKEIISRVKKDTIKNLVVIYNGLNKESNNEDNSLKKESINKYKKIKLHTDDIEMVREFINKEVL